MPDISAVLVHVDESRHCPVRIACAAATAQRCHATLSGLAVVPTKASRPAAPATGIETWNAAVAKHRQFVLERIAEHFAYLKRLMPGSDCRVAEIPDGGKIAAPIIREARRADLVVLGQNTADLASPDGAGAVAQDVMMSAGRPALIVPHVGQFDRIGRRPLVTWNESREAARAVQDALPLLRHAETVYLLEVGTPAATAADAARRRAALAGMARYLEAHALLVAVEYLPASDDGDVGKSIMARIAEQRADLLVMGGYGHPRLREIALGGVTRSILSAMDLPVLISH